MIMLTVFVIPLLVLLLLGVFVVGASVGTTNVTCIKNFSPPQAEKTTDSQPSQLSLPIVSWQADLSSLDIPAGE